MPAPEDNIMIPKGVQNPPVLEIMKFLKNSCYSRFELN